MGVYDMRVERELWILSRRFCLTVVVLICSDGTLAQYWHDQTDLITICPDHYYYGETPTVECRHNKRFSNTVANANCQPGSRGIQLLRGWEEFGLGNCNVSKENGLVSCPREDYTIDKTKYPKCKCEESDSNTVVFKVEFIPHDVQSGEAFRCTIDCQQSVGVAPLQLTSAATGSCGDIVVGCNVSSYGRQCESSCGRCSGSQRCNEETGECPQCEPGYQPPLCQNCTEFVTGDRCDQCPLPGFKPFNCTECLPGFKSPTCTECLPGFKSPNCTECLPGFKSPTCTECLPGFKSLNCTECLPGFKSPTCTECLPGFKSPNCTECLPGFKSPTCTECLPGFKSPTCTECLPGFKSTNFTDCFPGSDPPNGTDAPKEEKKIGLTTAETVAVLAGGAAATAGIAAVGFLALGKVNMCQMVGSRFVEVLELAQWAMEDAGGDKEESERDSSGSEAGTSTSEAEQLSRNA